jgi:hypothetical protein
MIQFTGIRMIPVANASSASCTDHAIVVDTQISQAPHEGLTHIPGVFDHAGSGSTCYGAQTGVAFRHYRSVGIPDSYYYAAQWQAHTIGEMATKAVLWHHIS